MVRASPDHPTPRGEVALSETGDPPLAGQVRGEVRGAGCKLHPDLCVDDHAGHMTPDGRHPPRRVTTPPRLDTGYLVKKDQENNKM